MQQADVLALAGLRIDGRRFDEIRTLRHNFGFDKTGSSDSSVYFESGLNKVCVLVQGPRESNRRADAPDSEKVGSADQSASNRNACSASLILPLSAVYHTSPAVHLYCLYCLYFCCYACRGRSRAPSTSLSLIHI